MSLPKGPFTGSGCVGGDGGNEFTECKWEDGKHALVVKGLDVWYRETSYLRGIQVTYSDGSRSQVFGMAADRHSSVIFAPGELITSMTLWDYKDYWERGHVGHIRLTTNKGQTFEVGSKIEKEQTAYDLALGSGMLLGIMGRCGWDVDKLGAIFLSSEITQVAVTDVEYNPDLAGTDKGIYPVALQQADFSNPAESKQPLDWDFSGGTSREQSTTYSLTSSTTYGASVSVEVSGKIFGIGAKATGGFEWQHQSSQTTASTTSTSVDFNWGIKGTLDPGESCTCTSLVQRGEGRTNYSATVEVKLKDGTTTKFRENGTYENIAYTKVDVQKKETTKAPQVV